MELLPDISKWITILLRWSHVFFAITWVGNSYLFNYLDNKLQSNIKEEVWSFSQPDFEKLTNLIFLFCSKFYKTTLV